jgi:hypothetical protein
MINTYESTQTKEYKLVKIPIHFEGVVYHTLHVTILDDGKSMF